MQLDLERRAARAAGLALSRAPSPRAARLDQGEWGASDNNRRAKYYALTRKGRARARRADRAPGASSRSPSARCSTSRSPLDRSSRGSPCWTICATACARCSAAARSSASWTRSCGSISSSTRPLDERAGVSRDEALRRARLAFGGVDRAKEESRDGRGVRVARGRVARPALRRAHARPQPGLHARRHRLADARHRRQHRDVPAAERAGAAHRCRSRSPQELVEVRLPDRDLRSRARQLSALSGHHLPALGADSRAPAGVLGDVRVGRRDGSTSRRAAKCAARRASGSAATTSPCSASRPRIGRLFTAADDRPGCGLPGAVVSYDFWQRELGGDRAARSAAR